MISCQIRPAQKKDMAEVLGLIKELATFEKEPEAVVISLSELERDGFGTDKLFDCFVAEVAGKIQGMALFYFRFSTWKGRTVHLEDLIVRKEFRGLGMGVGLYKKVMQFAQSQGVKRVEWVVLDWNEEAINFYEKTGATILKNWHIAQFDEQALKKFLTE